MQRARRAWDAANDRLAPGKALLEAITLHEARHTFASPMIAAGVNAKALASYLGHASITITLDRYGHLNARQRGRGCGAARRVPRARRHACPPRRPERRVFPRVKLVADLPPPASSHAAPGDQPLLGQCELPSNELSPVAQGSPTGTSVYCRAASRRHGGFTSSVRSPAKRARASRR
jgi:Phage integrase family